MCKALDQFIQGALWCKNHRVKQWCHLFCPPGASMNILKVASMVHNILAQLITLISFDQTWKREGNLSLWTSLYLQSHCGGWFLETLVGLIWRGLAHFSSGYQRLHFLESLTNALLEHSIYMPISKTLLICRIAQWTATAHLPNTGENSGTITRMTKFWLISIIGFMNEDLLSAIGTWGHDGRWFGFVVPTLHYCWYLPYPIPSPEPSSMRIRA